MYRPKKVGASTPITDTTTVVNAESDSPLTVSVRQAAKLLGISRNAAYEAVRTGEIHSIRIGRRVIIPKVVLLSMLSKTVY